MNILVVDDEKEIADVVELCFEILHRAGSIGMY